MSVDKKIGQLFMTGISGKALTAEESRFIQEHNIGGVILFSHNYENPAQLAELINSIQQLRDDYPLFIATDHEGGRVQRFKEPFSILPSARDIALLDSPKTAFFLSKIVAAELRCCGVNLNFSPVCDILVNAKNKVIGDRAFSNQEDQVTKFVSSVIRAYKTTDLMCCAKHFPGHGATTKDSHYSLPIVKTTMEELKEREFKPFVKAVKSRVEFIMMAHLIVDSINPDLPCSLAKEAYEIIRRDLKFQKIIITDDMQMGAITEHFGLDEASFMAIEAGADIVEFRDFENTVKSLEYFKKSHKVKKISNQLIQEKVTRIEKVKKEFLSEYKPTYIPDIQKVMTKKANQLFLDELKEKIEEKRLNIQ